MPNKFELSVPDAPAVVVKTIETAQENRANKIKSRYKENTQSRFSCTLYHGSVYALITGQSTDETDQGTNISVQTYSPNSYVYGLLVAVVYPLIEPYSRKSTYPILECYFFLLSLFVVGGTIYSIIAAKQERELVQLIRGLFPENNHSPGRS